VEPVIEFTAASAHNVTMMTNRAAAGSMAFAVLLSFVRLSAQRAPQNVPSPEVEQAIEAVLTEISAEEARFTEPRQPENKEWVKRRLEHLFNVDQKARGAYIRPRPAHWSSETREYYRKKLANRIIALDRAHTAELMELLKLYRWFTISEFGEKVEGYAWLLVQHSDFDVAFQQEVLAILTSLYPKGETSPSNYANLWDRVARNTGKLQRYGTQGHCVEPGRWEPYEVEDPAGLDQHRASVGLSTMAEYLRRSKERGYCP
jgi:hypothetical protein